VIPAPPAGADLRSAARLVRWYPASWRARYGAEFTELLLAEFAERPRCRPRTADVIRGGLRARLTVAGLTSHAMDSPDQIRASLATLCCALAAFLAFGISMWSQLTTGWQWAQPDTAATRAAMMMMSAAIAASAILALLGVVPAVCCAVLAAARGQGRLRRPVLLAALGAMVLVVGSRHFENGWPGTGALSWAHQGLVPGGVAAFSWASTLSVSAYWAHPGTLMSFPVTEVAWMAASPLAMLSLVAGAATAIRRLDMSARLLAFQVRIAGCATLAMAGFLVGAACWTLAGGAARRGLFHPGMIDVAGLAVMTAALLTSVRAAVSARVAVTR
jgi:hypothetical protein